MFNNRHVRDTPVIVSLVIFHHIKSAGMMPITFRFHTSDILAERLVERRISVGMSSPWTTGGFLLCKYTKPQIHN